MELTQDQIIGLIKLARMNAVFWEQIKHRELEMERVYAEAERKGRNPYDEPLTEPTLVTMVSDLVPRHYGTERKSNVWLVVFSIRHVARQELGLPTDLSVPLTDAEIDELRKRPKRRKGKSPKRAMAKKKVAKKNPGRRKPRAKRRTQKPVSSIWNRG